MCIPYTLYTTRRVLFPAPYFLAFFLVYFKVYTAFADIFPLGVRSTDLRKVGTQRVDDYQPVDYLFFLHLLFFCFLFFFITICPFWWYTSSIAPRCLSVLVSLGRALPPAAERDARSYKRKTCVFTESCTFSFLFFSFFFPSTAPWQKFSSVSLAR